MSISTRKKLLFILLFIAALVLVLFWAKKSDRSWHKVTAEPDTEIYAIQQEQIQRFIYKSTDLSLIATRKSSPAGDFQIEMKFKDGRPSEMCISGVEFKSILSKFTSIKAKRTFKDNSVLDHYPIDLGSVLIKDTSELSPASWKFRSTKDKSAVLAIDELQSYEVNVDADSLEKLKEGCKRLSRE